MRYGSDLLPWSVELFFDIPGLAGAAQKTMVVTTQTLEPDWLTIMDFPLPNPVTPGTSYQLGCLW